MRIGVLAAMQHSMFSGGLHSLTISIAETLTLLGHTVELINTVEGTRWWDDCTDLSGTFHVQPLATATDYDICVECGPLTLSTEVRPTVAKKSIWVLSSPFLLKELESSIFPMTTNRRDFKGLSEIWMMDANCGPDDKEALQLLSRVPVRMIPYIWSPSIVSAYKKELPPWQPAATLTVHVAETHTTNTSSCVLPLVILREAVVQRVPIGCAFVHSETISTSKYFQENTLKHCTDAGLKVNFVGRQRCVDWLQEPGSCVLSHIRFKGLRPLLLDLAWCGIPFVHNASVIKDLGYYYEGNDVDGAVAALASVTAKPWNSNRFSPAAATAALGAALAPTTPLLRIGFCDMWSNFNPAYNFFTLLLQHVAPSITILGGPAQGNEDLVIFGPFSNTWRSLPPSQPKVHFTGENTEPVIGAALNLGFRHAAPSESYMRFPLWILYIDWFGATPSKMVNPIPIPLEVCTSPPGGERSKFCAFIVSNPNNTIRNDAFEALRKYRPVDSAGRVFNTLGPELLASSETQKVAFLRDYKFSITYENTSAPGYCTEKFLHAKAAGCVPIYWGDPLAEGDFNMDGCIDARKLSETEMVAAVQALDTDSAEWARRAAIPALDAAKIAWAKRQITELGGRLLALAGRSGNALKTFVVNLDRRPDRLARLGDVQAERWPAVDGRKLRLDPPLRALLASNDFFWKKAIAGCALSHITLWTKLAAEPPETSYLILEDDVTLIPGWQEKLRLARAGAHTDILYLGGVLPPNKPVFEKALERVTEYVARIAPNQFFGQPQPTRQFHLCTYAYCLTSAAATKLLAAVAARGVWTSVDHILLASLETHITYPLLAGCFQDDDPVYQAAQFNDFSRIDTFDSDLWNNDERFEVGEATAVPRSAPLASLRSIAPPFVSVRPINTRADHYEIEWLEYLLGTQITVRHASASSRPTDCPVVIVQRPHWTETIEMLKTWSASGVRFKILHLSDEFSADPLDFYGLPGCVGVLRNYSRVGTGSAVTIPLGYHWTPVTQPTAARTTIWSFAGTDWNGRGTALAALPPAKSHLSLFYTWEDQAALNKEAYLKQLSESIFAPCPAGNNPETFRLYEALECGAIPLVVGPNPCPGIPLLPLKTWEEAAACMKYLLAHQDRLEAYRDTLLKAWASLKVALQTQMREWLHAVT
jgi:alpha(1,3/1,4) fucosyltransferase